MSGDLFVDRESRRSVMGEVTSRLLAAMNAHDLDAFVACFAGDPTLADNGLPYTTLSYGNGTHSGEDVAMYAAGPRAHLFRGTVEQGYIGTVIFEALGLSP
jgi:alkaline phosphatase